MTLHAPRHHALAAAAAFSLALAGCGSEDEDYANDERPPAPIVVTASISDERVSVSPETFGAGPIDLIITNQSGRSHQVTLETDEAAGGKPGIRQETAPINPRDTATVKADVRQGTYAVRAGGGVAPGRITVTGRRPSSQNDLLQP